jgi:hypothetical protein
MTLYYRYITILLSFLDLRKIHFSTLLEWLENIEFWLTYIMCKNNDYLKKLIVFTHNIS